MRDFTIVLCSRKRENYLRDCLEHIEKNSKTDIEVLIGCDIDDIHYLEISGDLEKKFGFCKFYFQTSYSSMQDYLNFMARGSLSKYVLVLNDDSNIKSKYWDVNALKILNGHSIVYGKTFDNSLDKIGSFYTGFPIISRESINRLGFVLEPTMKDTGADVVTARIYNDANKVVDLTNLVKIDHVMHSTPEALRSKNNEHINMEVVRRTMSAGFSIDKLMSIDISKYVRLLNE